MLELQAVMKENDDAHAALKSDVRLLEDATQKLRSQNETMNGMIQELRQMTTMLENDVNESPDANSQEKLTRTQLRDARIAPLEEEMTS